MRRFLAHNSLSIVFGLLFLGAVVGQALVGHGAYNEEQLAHGGQAISLGRYLASSAFGQAVMENWQSEYLQFTLFIVLTVWLIQAGSPESKEPHKAGRESEHQQKVGPHADEGSPRWARVGGLRQAVYSNSLLIVMGVIFIGSLFAQSVTGWTDFNNEQSDHDLAEVSWWTYLGKPSFWEQVLQNWQSEFLAVGSMAVLAIYLRQRGSPESKPVGAKHHETGVEG